MTEKSRGAGVQDKVTALWNKARALQDKLTLEPAMMIDGLSYSIMIVAVENIQMDKICLVNLNYTQEVCGNLSAYPEALLEHQKEFSVFGMWYGVVTAILPLFFILFVGAWSDKYGRKPPLIAAVVGHTMWSLCYLLNAYISSWPVEMLFLAAVLDTMGGGTVSFLTACNAYISDVTKENERTSRVGLANSLWFLGGPLGTLLGTYIYKYGGYLSVFGVSTVFQIFSFFYICSVPESRGPFSEFDINGVRIKKKTVKNESTLEAITNSKAKEIEFHNNNNNNDDDVTTEEGLTPEKVPLSTMIRDVFDYHRIIDSFRSTFRKREGNARTFVLLLITCNLLRRLGRGAYMYLFTRKVLDWGPTDYGVWVSYKNLVSAVGSLVAVPVLSTHVGLSDNVLALIGAVAAITDYLMYGLITASTEFLIWLAPIGGLLVNSCVIAIRSMLSKFVPGDELGKVSAVMGALDGVMPMASFSLYTLVYKSSVHVFPGAQFFFGSGANLLCTFIFVFIIYFTKTKSYSIDDLNPEEPKRAVTLKGFRDLSDNRTPEEDEENSEPNNMDRHSRLVVGVLSGENFHIASTHQRRKAQLRPIKSYGGHTSLFTISAASLSPHVPEGKVNWPLSIVPQFLLPASQHPGTSLHSVLSKTISAPNVSSTLVLTSSESHTVLKAPAENCAPCPPRSHRKTHHAHENPAFEADCKNERMI